MAYRGTVVVIDVRAPLASTFDWVSRLRGLTGGRGTATMKVAGYDVVPYAIARSVLAKS